MPEQEQGAEELYRFRIIRFDSNGNPVEKPRRSRFEDGPTVLELRDAHRESFVETGGELGGFEAFALKERILREIKTAYHIGPNEPIMVGSSADREYYHRLIELGAI